MRAFIIHGRGDVCVPQEALLAETCVISKVLELGYGMEDLRAISTDKYYLVEPFEDSLQS